MDINDLYHNLEKFYELPPGKMSHRKLEELYDKLLDLLLEYEEQLEDDVYTFLQDTIIMLECELDRQDKELKNLSARLIADPAEVERILSLMTFDELFHAEKRAKKLRSPALRKQFTNMVNRCWPRYFAGIC